MEKQSNNPGVVVMPPPKPTHRHPDDPGFKMQSNFGFGHAARQPQYLSSGRYFTTIRSHSGECLLILTTGTEVRTIIPTGMDYSLVDQIERLIDRFWR